MNFRNRTASMFRKRALSNGLIGAQVGETLKVGYLRKKGHVRRNWLDRWFVLTTEGLYYYKAKGDPKPLGVIPLVRAEVKEDTTGRHVNVFTCVTIEGKDYPIQASTKDEMCLWIKVISEAMTNATARANRGEGPPPLTASIPESESQNGATRKESTSYDSFDDDDD